MLLASLGGALGLLVAVGGGAIVLGSGLLPDWIDAAIDARTLGFTLLVSLATGFFFGAMPALSAAGFRPSTRFAKRAVSAAAAVARGARATRSSSSSSRSR